MNRLLKIAIFMALFSASAFGQGSGVGQIWTSPNATLQNGATANGNGSTLNVQGVGGVMVTVNCSVACSGGTTVTFELSQDGTHYSSVSAQELGAVTFSSTVVNQGTTPTLWYVNAAGAEYLETPISSYSAGTITVTATAVGTPVIVGPVNVQGISGGTAIPVSGTFWQTTQPVSLSSLPALASGSNTIGTVDIAASQTIAVTQATASSLNATVVGSLSNNGASATSNAVAALPAIVQTTPANGSAFTQGRNAAPNVDTGGNSWVSIQPSLRPAHYSASANFAASSTTDNACIYGNATDTVELLEVDVSGIQTTGGIVNVALNRHSAAESGGTSANMTVIKGDTTNYGSADSTPVSYTGTGPTTTNIGSIDQKYTEFNATSATLPSDLYVWDGRSEPQLLIGTSQGVCVNIGGALTGGTLSVAFRWKEISNISE